MYSLPKEPGSIGHTLDAGFTLYYASFKRVIGISVLAALSIYVPGLIVGVGGALGGEPTKGLVIGLLVPALVVCLGLYLVLYLAMLHRVGSIAQGRDPGFRASVRAGAGRLLPVLGASLLYFLAMVGGTLLFIVPGIILMVSMAFYSLCILFDGDGVFESLSHSHGLVWGNWWRTTVVYTVVVIVYMVLYMAIGLPLAFVDDLVFDSQAGQGLFAMLGDIAASVITFPLMVSVFFVVFHDLKLRKEGHDLEARVEALAASS